MRAMMLDAPGQPLKLGHLAVPEPAAHDVLLKVLACGVCRTDLHILDGELPAHKPGMVPGHEVVGRVVRPCRHPLAGRHLRALRLLRRSA